MRLMVEICNRITEYQNPVFIEDEQYVGYKKRKYLDKSTYPPDRAIQESFRTVYAVANLLPY